MADQTEKPKLGTRPPLGLKRTVETGKVKQSFSHGRSNTVVVEVKKRRILGRPGEAPPRRGAQAGRRSARSRAQAGAGRARRAQADAERDDMAQRKELQEKLLREAEERACLARGSAPARRPDQGRAVRGRASPGRRKPPGRRRSRRAGAPPGRGSARRAGASGRSPPPEPQIAEPARRKPSAGSAVRATPPRPSAPSRPARAADATITASAASSPSAARYPTKTTAARVRWPRCAAPAKGKARTIRKPARRKSRSATSTCPRRSPSRSSPSAWANAAPIWSRRCSRWARPSRSPRPSTRTPPSC